MTIVSVQQTKSYERDQMRAAINAHFETLGIEGDLHPGMKVLIKPNLLCAHRPEQAATTHPAVVAAIVEWLADNGIEDITIADSPGGTYRKGYLKGIYEACGYLPLSGDAALNYDTGFVRVVCPEGFKSRDFNIINPIVNADYIINVAKLKTHALATMTAGVKNLFGAIPGLQKPEWHFKKPDIKEFAHTLIELALVVAPQVTVIDAVETMEGNGPLNGTVRRMDLTLASRDVFGQDYVAAQLMGFDPQAMPIVHQAIQMKLIEPKQIKTVGFEVQPAEPPYKLPDSIREGNNRGFLLRTVSSVIKRIYCPVPYIDTQKCIGCGKCAESCPMKIIKIEDRKADMSVKDCISCFCCQEMCPADAVRVRRVFKMPKL